MVVGASWFWAAVLHEGGGGEGSGMTERFRRGWLSEARG